MHSGQVLGKYAVFGMYNKKINNMCCIKFYRVFLNRIIVLAMVFTSQTVMAGFLDMPEIAETPELRGKTMLRDLDIPSVRDRNPDPKSGPRLAVKEFRIQGLVEYPELGITREAINHMVENIRQDLMGEGKLLPSGYTIKELGELSDLLVDIEDETLKRHVTPLEVQRLVWLVRDQRSKRGIHLGQIEAIADRITRFYRERGFILAKAYIPRQEVRDGIVNLTLLLGMLGEVNVKGNELYASEDITDVFDDMLTKPVTTERVEENLYLLNDYPGLTVDGYFEPGYQVGDTKLNINVKRQRWYDANLRIDNHGTKETGKNRYYADFQFNNTLGLADSLQLSVLEASSPSNTSYYRFSYKQNLFSPRWKIQLNYSKNQFVIDQSSLLANSNQSKNLTGVVNLTDIGVRYQFKRGRETNHSVELKYEKYFSDLESEIYNDSSDELDEKLENYVLKYNYDTLNEKSKRLHQGSIKYVTGRYLHVGQSVKDKEYDFVSADYTLLAFAKVPFFDANSRFIVRANAQYADKYLSSILKFSLGGPTRARAYASNMFSADDAYYVGMDWVFNSPDFMNFSVFDINLKEFIKPFVFADYAYGRQASLISSKSVVKARASDLGFGLQFAKGSNFKGHLMVAYPTGVEYNGTNLEPPDDDKRYVFDFQYTF